MNYSEEDKPFIFDLVNLVTDLSKELMKDQLDIKYVVILLDMIDHIITQDISGNILYDTNNWGPLPDFIDVSDKHIVNIDDEVMFDTRMILNRLFSHVKTNATTHCLYPILRYERLMKEEIVNNFYNYNWNL